MGDSLWCTFTVLLYTLGNIACRIALESSLLWFWFECRWPGWCLKICGIVQVTIGGWLSSSYVVSWICFIKQVHISISVSTERGRRYVPDSHSKLHLPRLHHRLNFTQRYSTTFSRMGSVWAIIPCRTAVRPSSNIFSAVCKTWLDDLDLQTQASASK